VERQRAESSVVIKDVTATPADADEQAVAYGAPATTTSGRRWRVDSRWLLVFLSYAIPARLLYVRFSWFPTTQIPFRDWSDQVQEVWFYGWMAHAVSHLQNLFFTTALNFPHGVNLMTNTTSPLLGVLFAPLTWLAGPLATYVVLLELGFALTALSAAVCARRLGLGWWRAWFVGAVFGFCAHRIVEGTTHVFLAFDLTMPWVLYGAIRFFQGRWSVRRFGLVVGVLLAVEFLVSTERVGIELAGLALVALFDVIHHRTWARVRDVVLGYALTGACFVALASLPLWYFFFGPQSISGPPHTGVAWENVTLRQLVQPGPYTLFAPLGHTTTAESRELGAWNSTGYLGVPLLALAIVGVVRSWREPLTRGVTALTVIFLVLTLGPSVELPGLHLSIPAPYRLVAKLPVGQDILPFRYMEIVVLGLAWLAATGLGGLVLDRAARRYGAAVAAITLAVLTILSLVPAGGVPEASTLSNGWLQTPQAARALPDSAVVLTYPYAVTIFNSSMLDEAESGLWYHLIGGQAIVPGPSGSNVSVLPLEPLDVVAVLMRATLPHPTGRETGFPFKVPVLPPLDATTIRQFHEFVTNNHVTEIFWRQWGWNPQVALAYLQAAFGPGASYANGTVRIWNVG
jgi:hypothetical protein